MIVEYGHIRRTGRQHEIPVAKVRPEPRDYTEVDSVAVQTVIRGRGIVRDTRNGLRLVATSDDQKNCPSVRDKLSAQKSGK